MAKIAKIVLADIKDPDGFGELIQNLELSSRTASKFFEFHEYASIELEVKEDLTFTGRFLPKKGSR